MEAENRLQLVDGSEKQQMYYAREKASVVDGSGFQAEEFRLLGNGEEKLISKLFFVSYHQSQA